MVTSGSLRVVSHNGQILESVNNLFALPSIQRWRVTYQSIQKIWLQFVTTAWFVKKFLHWSELQRKGVSILALTALTSLFWSLGCRRRFLFPEIGDLYPNPAPANDQNLHQPIFWTCAQPLNTSLSSSFKGEIKKCKPQRGCSDNTIQHYFIVFPFVTLQHISSS